MLAVIKTGGKQYKVAPGQKIKIEKIKTLLHKNFVSDGSTVERNTPVGQEVVFDDVLLVSDDKKNIKIGQPKVQGAKVVGKVLRQEKGDKVIVFKYKSKKRYKVKRGHRQIFAEVEIVDIRY